jgi:hypothetical protein
MFQILELCSMLMGDARRTRRADAVGFEAFLVAAIMPQFLQSLFER